MSFFRLSTLAAGVAALAIAGCGGETSAPAQDTKLLATAAASAFGVTSSGGYLTVSTGAGLVFKVREAGGDITSIVYNGGPELQGQTKYSHISSGIGATVAYSVSGTVAKITLTTSTLTHYFLVRSGENNIYMGTYVTAEPSVGELRWITRLNGSALTGVPAESRLIGNTGAIESADIFGMSDGTTRSKYYGNQRAIDYTVRGVTGSNVGVYMVYGNRESSSGGPFFRDIQNQSGTDTEVYNYMNSGHNQTEANRMGFHGPYALMFTAGAAPSAPDMSWMGNYNLNGWVAATGRGRVIGNGLAGRDANYVYTVGFANSTAQYWTTANAASNGSFGSYNMKPGTYTMTVYKGELEVYEEQVTVSAGAATSLNTRTINNDPGA
ncbi:MAG: rhamnogalacturonan lyase B N-terminal domain-containing protein, partial [Massilia sp.]